MGSQIPLVVFEGLLVAGGALAFGWWQIRSVRREQREVDEARAAERARAAAVSPAADVQTRQAGEGLAVQSQKEPRD